jgi:hypothetical protein
MSIVVSEYHKILWSSLCSLPLDRYQSILSLKKKILVNKSKRMNFAAKYFIYK